MNIVWFSEIKWDYLRTRKQQIIKRKPADMEVLYLEPYARKRDNNFHISRDEGIYRATVPFIKSPPTYLYKKLLSLKTVRKAVDRGAAGRVRRLCREVSFAEGDERAFILSNIYAIGAAHDLPRKCLLYDCNDAHDSFPGMPAWTGDYFKRTCSSADFVTVSSSILAEKVRAIRHDDNIEMIGNGVEYEHFARRFPRPPNGRRRRHFTLGYVGAVAPWIDFDLLKRLAADHADWRLVITGPVLGGSGCELDELKKLPNVSCRGPVPYEQLPEIMESFDIGLIPFRFTDLTKGVNPNKLYEYFAAGLPVVATGFSPEVKAHPRAAFTADDYSGFSNACEKAEAALRDASEAAIMRKEAESAARKNDWIEVAAAFWDRMRKLMKGDGRSGRVL